MITYRRILVPSDFDLGATSALAAALALAGQSDAAVGIFHVMTAPSSFALYAEGFEWPTDALNAEADKMMNGVVTEARARHARVTGSIVMGVAWEAILAQIDHFAADLVVMGKHGRHCLGRMLLGSVAEKVVRLSPVPVLIVPLEPRVAASARAVT